MIAPEVHGSLASAVVTVENPAGKRGAGFIGLDNGLTVTSASLVGSYAEVSIGLFHPPQQVSAAVIYVDVGQDLAFIIPRFPVSRRPLALGDSSALQLGQSVHAVGRNSAGAVAASAGVVASLERWVDRRLFMQHDAVIDPPSLGGPVIDEAGAVIGISAHSQESAGERMALMIPLHIFIEPLRAHTGDPITVSAYAPTYLCASCGATFARTDARCSSCGVTVPFQRGLGLVEAPQRAQTMALVNALMERMGQDPSYVRTGPDRWRLGDVTVKSSDEGHNVSFEIGVVRVPPQRQEAFYRFLLTFADESSDHATPSISDHNEVLLHFCEPVQLLSEKEIGSKLQSLRGAAARLRGLLEQGFGAEPIGVPPA